MIELLNMDCMDYMAGLEDNAFELAIVDPPYGIGADAKNSGPNSETHKLTCKAIQQDYKIGEWDKNIPDESYFCELKRVSKNQIIWGANYYPLFGGMIFWDKLVDMPTYSDGEIAYCSMINSIRKFTFRWNGMLQGNMKQKEYRIHPTQKPVALYKWLLANYAKDGDKILDTHLGSGSSAIAAHYGGFDFVGMELDKDYYEAACKRFDEETAQIAMVL